MSAPNTVADEIERLLRLAGSRGMRHVDLAAAKNVGAEAISKPLRRLMLAGRIARLRMSHRNVRYFAADYAPADAERMEPIEPKQAQRQKAREEALHESHQRCLQALQDVGERGAVIMELADMVQANVKNLAQRLNDLERAGMVGWRRDADQGKGHLRKRWYLAARLPKQIAVAPLRRLTSIRDANVTMPQGEPIITPATKVTVCPSGTDQRFTFSPPPGWVGQITRDWREGRMGQQR